MEKIGPTGPVGPINFLLRDLPDQNGPRLFLERLAKEQPRAHQALLKQPALLADVLALAAWSPLLATTVEQNPEYLSWLSRERADPRVRTADEFKEALARFALTNSALNPQVLLARFRRRELLRTYLHDIRRSQTLVETMEELSNLADAILDYALSLARQDLDNRYGLPRRVDDRGRSATAEFCVIALGKLGSMELNYASDIDLVFLYSDDGTTSGTGQRGEVSNREYFVKLSETIARLVGQSGGEGAAYRVDLRLRPHGRDGALACSLQEAVRYYMHTAQDWERQALIRSRAAVGSAELFSRFKAAATPAIFRPDVSVSGALASVRLAKQKIDRKVEKKSGFKKNSDAVEFVRSSLSRRRFSSPTADSTTGCVCRTRSSVSVASQIAASLHKQSGAISPTLTTSYAVLNTGYRWSTACRRIPFLKAKTHRRLSGDAWDSRALRILRQR